MNFKIRKALVFIIVLIMSCISMTGLVGSNQLQNINSVKYQNKAIDYNSYFSTEETTMRIANQAQKYLDLKENPYKNFQNTAEEEKVKLPWIGKQSAGDMLEWYVRLVYNGQEFLKQVPISIRDFEEKFLKHPEYGEKLRFNVDGDSADDVEVIIGFYWSNIMYPDGQQQTSLETRFRVRQINDEIADQNAEFEVWSEIHLNYGIVKDPKARSISRNTIFNKGKIGEFISQLLDKFKNREKRIFDLIKDLFNRIINSQDNSDGEIGTLDADDDYLSVGAGYRSPQGEQIPLFTEKRFSFAKGVDWTASYATIFKPTIFQHQMSPGNNVVGDEKIDLLYGFRAFEAASSSAQYDIAFMAEFEPSVNLKTKFIPRSAYVYYFWNIPKQDNYGGWTPRSSPTRVSFTADIKTKTYAADHESLPKITLELDKIDSNLASSSGKWFSLDLNLLGFEYKASQKFDVGLIVDVPSMFSEKVEVKGIPTSVVCKWGIDKLDLNIRPKHFEAGLGVYAELVMSSNIEKVTVFYPKTDPDAPEAPFLEVYNIPSSQRVFAGGSIDIYNGSLLNVDVSANAGLSSSGSIDDIIVYYPKADPYDPNVKFLSIPKGIPGRADVNAYGKLDVDLNGITTNQNNYVYGRVTHTCDADVREINVFLPDDQSIPFIKFTDIPARVETKAELYWNKLQGFGYSNRQSASSFDPVTILLEYGDFSLYNKLEIRDGFIYTRFKFANDGYFDLDTSKKMISNDFKFIDKRPGNEKELRIYIEEVSADDLRTSWSVTTDGDKLKFNSLSFGGIVDTLKNLNLEISMKSKNVDMNFDWEIADKGSFFVQVDQDDDLPLHFDLSKDGLYESHIDVTLSQVLQFDASWDWTQGYIENGQVHPGHITINKQTSGPNLKYFDFYFVYQDTYGVDVQFYDLEVFLDFEWARSSTRLRPYVWLEYYVSVSDMDIDLLWPDANNNIQWHRNVEDWLDPHPP
jgi:hypothetical protein